MRRQLPGILLLFLAAWMCALTFVVIYYPDVLLGERAEDIKQKVEQKKIPEEPPKEAQSLETAILVAAKNLKWQEINEIKADMFEAKPYPNSRLPDGYIKANETHEIEGQILMVDLNQGEPLLRYKLHRDQARLIEDRTAPNQRAMAVKVNDIIGVAGFIKPYSRVDVLVTLLKRKPPETRTVLRNVLVLATGPRGDRAAASPFADRVAETLPDRVAESLVSEQSKGEKQAPNKVNVVTLQVSPQQAEKLALAASEGKLRLVLRNPRDKEPGETRGITLKALLAEGQPRRRAAKKVIVIKGSDIKTQYINR